MFLSAANQVVGAKVVTNARKPGSRCYGFVTMSSAEEAAKCIQQLHRTELHGKMISVEKVGRVFHNILIRLNLKLKVQNIQSLILDLIKDKFLLFDLKKQQHFY